MSPSDQDVDAFLDSVSEVSRLIDGLKAGTISPEYIDNKIAQRDDSVKRKSPEKSPHGVLPAAEAAEQQDATAAEAAKQAELLKKVEELKANRQRKLKARRLYEGYVQGKRQHQHGYATDYTQWELWCPSDDEDDMFNSLTPNSPEFRAMEKDISTRHARMVEQRQIAERQRQLGNAAFKAGQYSEALRCYETGLETQRHNMALHANAAMAALRLKCYVAAQEHCDKVLHLAEVLHDTPKHPLCVKALQRRAAAHQGLGQHSKAVSDLQAAADMLPGDAEVMKQLQRACQLLEEHRTAKQLVCLVEPQKQQQQQQRQGMLGNDKPDSGPPCHLAPSSPGNNCDSATGPRDQTATASSKDHSAVDSSSTEDSQDGIVARLQCIKQLISSLDEAVNTAGCDQQGQRAAQACQELQGLVQGDAASIFFRSSGGLDIASKLVIKPTHHEAQAAGLQLLCAVCDCDTALEQLSEQVLSGAIDLISSQQPAVALAALDLAYTASTCTSVRAKLGVQLLKKAQQEEQQYGRLVGLWGVCCGSPLVGSLKPDTKQVLAASLLSNCMLVPAVRTAMVLHLQQAPHTLMGLAEMLSSCTPGAAIKVYGLLSNMCNHAGLRAEIAHCKLLLQHMLHEAHRVTAHQPRSAEPRNLQLAVLGCLCNLSLEPNVQQALCAQDGLIAQLLQLAVHGVGGAATSTTCSSSGIASSRSLAAAPKLPLRAKDRHCNAPNPEPPAAIAQDSCCVASRAATVLSRAAKQAPGTDLLLQRGALGLLAGAIPPVLDALLPAHTPGQGQQHLVLHQPHTQLDSIADTAGDWIAAAVRTLAILTGAPDSCSSCSPDDTATAIDACCRLLRSTPVQDTVRGNAALVVKGFAADSRQRWHRELTRADAVEALITAARFGKGGPSSKNAGITLALLARADGVFIERMRELRGLEVLHAYVRPS